MNLHLVNCSFVYYLSFIHVYCNRENAFVIDFSFELYQYFNLYGTTEFSVCCSAQPYGVFLFDVLSGNGFSFYGCFLVGQKFVFFFVFIISAIC